MVKEVVDAGTKLIQILDNVTSIISDSSALNVVTKTLSGIIDMIEKLTSALGWFNAPLATAGIYKLVQLAKGKDTGGGRAKRFALRENMPPNRLAERCTSPGVYRSDNMFYKGKVSKYININLYIKIKHVVSPMHMSRKTQDKDDCS